MGGRYEQHSLNLSNVIVFFPSNVTIQYSEQKLLQQKYVLLIAVPTNLMFIGEYPAIVTPRCLFSITYLSHSNKPNYYQDKDTLNQGDDGRFVLKLHKTHPCPHLDASRRFCRFLESGWSRICRLRLLQAQDSKASLTVTIHSANKSKNKIHYSKQFAMGKDPFDDLDHPQNRVVHIISPK